MGCCCFKQLKRKSTIKPSTTFWDKTQSPPNEEYNSPQLQQGKSGGIVGDRSASKRHFTSSTENINFFYTFQRTLGQNKYGIIKEATRKTDETQKKYIVNIMPRYQHEQQNRREIENLVKLDHPAICKFYETYIDNDNVYLVMEYCAGGSLSTRSIHQKGEAFIAGIIYSLVTAVIHMHSLGVIHRNLNLKNILFADKECTKVKIINFKQSIDTVELDKQVQTKGMARSLTKRVGTDGFSAPEVLSSTKYGNECDVWSLGVIAFCLLSGQMPFYSDEEVIRGTLSFSGSIWKDISKAAKVAIGKMLEPIVKKRITLAKLLKEDWFNLMSQNKLSVKAIEYDLDELLVADKIRNYGGANKFKQACFKILVKHAKDEDLQKARNTFEQIDKDKNGYLEKDELRKIIEEQVYFKDQSKKNLMLMLQLLFNSSRQLTLKYTDFLAATLDDAYFSQTSIKALFKYLDTDSNEFLDFKDLQDIMAREGTRLSDEEAKYILEDVTCYLKEGKLYYDDFYRLMIEDQTKIKETMRVSSARTREANNVNNSRRGSQQVVNFDNSPKQRFSVSQYQQQPQQLSQFNNINNSPMRQQQPPGGMKRGSEQLIMTPSFNVNNNNPSSSYGNLENSRRGSVQVVNINSYNNASVNGQRNSVVTSSPKVYYNNNQSVSQTGMEKSQFYVNNNNNNNTNNNMKTSMVLITQETDDYGLEQSQSRPGYMQQRNQEIIPIILSEKRPRKNQI